MEYSLRLHEAIETAALVHKGQERKNPIGVPFVSHCYAVARLVEQYYEDEDAIIGALLHDAIEDNPVIGKSSVLAFGQHVFELVDAVSEVKFDADGNKVKWRQRKTLYAERLKYAPFEAKAISAADKIHNIRSILMAIDNGVDIWSLMTTNQNIQVERYDELLLALSTGWEHPLLLGFAESLDMLRQRV